MSKQELATAFIEGRISRRTLIRRLTAAGVTTGAAVSYAHLLSPRQAEAATPSAAVADDHYPLVDLKVVSPSLAKVRQSGRLQVSIASSEELVRVSMRVFLRTRRGGVPIGQRVFENPLSEAGTRKLSVPVDKSTFKGRRKARFYVQAFGVDAEGYQMLASGAKTLR